MAFAVMEIDEGKVLEIHVNGRLSEEAYAKFVPLTEERIERFGKVRMLVAMQNFHGWDAGTLWDDLALDTQHLHDIERLAIVGDAKWEQGMSAFCRPFTNAKIQYFDDSQIAQARVWIRTA